MKMIRKAKEFLKDAFYFRILWRPKWARPQFDFQYMPGDDWFDASLWIALPGWGVTIFFPSWIGSHKAAHE